MAAARLAVENAEAGKGWLGLTAERVAEKLDGADIETRRSFVREMVRVFVFPVGSGRRVPIEKRIKVQYLTAGKGDDPAVPVEAPEWNGVPVPVPVRYLPVEEPPPDTYVHDENAPVPSTA